MFICFYQINISQFYQQRGHQRDDGQTHAHLAPIGRPLRYSCQRPPYWHEQPISARLYCKFLSTAEDISGYFLNIFCLNKYFPIPPTEAASAWRRTNARTPRAYWSPAPVWRTLATIPVLQPMPGQHAWRSMCWKVNTKKIVNVVLLKISYK